MACGKAEGKSGGPKEVPLKDAYAEVEAHWRGVRDYESLQKPPLVDAPWRQELLEFPEVDPRCRATPTAKGRPRAFELEAPGGVGRVFLFPGMVNARYQLVLADGTLRFWARPPNHSNLWPGPPEGAGPEAAADALERGLESFLERGGGWHVAEDPSAPEALVEKLRWVTLGRQYDWDARAYPSPDNTPELPGVLAELALTAAEAVELPVHGRVDAAICNIYHAARRPSDRLGGHRDDVEADVASPLVTLSLGLPGIFLLGGETREARPIPILLRGGAAMIMAGRARHLVHGVPTVLVPPPLQLKGRGPKRSVACGESLNLADVYGPWHKVEVAPPTDDAAQHDTDRLAAASWLLARARMSFSIRSVGDRLS